MQALVPEALLVRQADLLVMDVLARVIAFSQRALRRRRVIVVDFAGARIALRGVLAVVVSAAMSAA